MVGPVLFGKICCALFAWNFLNTRHAIMYSYTTYTAHLYAITLNSFVVWLLYSKCYVN